MYEPNVGSIAFVEFFPKVPMATKRYFENVLGWKMDRETVSGVDIWFSAAGNGPGVHMMRPMGDLAPGSTVAFVRVSSVDEMARKVKKSGGKVIVPKYEVPGRGWFAWFAAPGGVVHAVYQPKQKRIYRPKQNGKR